MKKFVGKAALRNLGISVTPGFTDILSAWQEYQRIVATETTKRQEIAAWQEVQLAEIQARRDLLIGYLERSFDERAANFRALFEAMDFALERDDNAQLALLLAAMVELAQTSPFRDLSDPGKVQAAFADPNHVWEL